MDIYRGEYVWIDGYSGLRSKTKIVRSEKSSKNQCLFDLTSSNPATGSSEPNLYEIFGTWNFDGSSTHQATTESSEVHLKPVLICRDYYRSTESPHNTTNILDYLILCETYCDAELTKPHPSNTRYNANLIMEQYKDSKPLFGIEQEFFLFDNHTGRPLTWTNDLLRSARYSEHLGPEDDTVFSTLTSNPDHTGRERHYCGLGAGKVSSRDLLERVVNEALSLGFDITGMNYEVAPGQAEFQICEYGIKAADNLVLLRYILARAAEREGLRLDLSAKPMRVKDLDKPQWNGSGCHVNFSTEEMRNEGGYEVILATMSKLQAKHLEHIACYGDDNAERLTGKNETSGMDKFSYGVANRGASVRIPSIVARNGKGYFEDRRPSGSMDPYKVTSKLLETVFSG